MKKIPPASALPPLYTLTDAADKLGYAVSTLHERAVEHNIGALTVGGGFRIFTETDLAALEKAKKPRGNPNFGRSKSKAG